MADKPEDRRAGIKPLHSYIVAGLVRVAETEIGRRVLLTMEDDDNYDSFKMDPGNREGPWCTLRPTGFDLETRGQGLTTSVRPFALYGPGGTDAMKPTHSRVGSYALAASEIGMGTKEVAFASGDMILHRDGWQPGRNDVLTLRIAGGASSVVTSRERLPDTAEGNARYRIDVDDAPGSMPLSGLSGGLDVYVRRAAGTSVSMVPAMFRFTLRYATTDSSELLDFFAKWAFMRARQRLNYVIRYLGRAVPVHVQLGSGMDISPKTMPGEEASYHVYEGELEVSGAFTHDDVRDARIEPLVVDLDFGIQLSRGTERPERASGTDRHGVG